MRGQSFHHFHGYAVRDRVDLSKLSDKPPAHTTPEPSIFLPSQTDLNCLKEELTILIARYIQCMYIKYNIYMYILHI